jgi:hypothetical protein
MALLDDMYVANVSSLPWPHGLFRCPNVQAFESVTPEADRAHAEKCQSVVEATISSLSDGRLRNCPYHRPDWKLAARLAIDWWRGRRGDDQPTDFALVLAEANLSIETQWASESFFAEPIWIDGPLLGNGQHRVCAMKLAGVERCLVEA